MKSSIKLNSNDVTKLLGAPELELPKYASQIINLANSNAQGTRPKIVGQMSDLIQEFPGDTLEEWERWYSEKNPHAINEATKKIVEMVDNFKQVIKAIDNKMIESWVKDLVIYKTFAGLKFQEAIIIKIAELLQDSYRLATPDEESKGIDGFIGDKPVSIKPSSYKLMNARNERIQAKIIYYTKEKTDIRFDISEVL